MDILYNFVMLKYKSENNCYFSQFNRFMNIIDDKIINS